MTRCAGASFLSLIPFVTPVLPGPGSDIGMKMGWKVQSKTRKSGVWFFQRKGSYQTAWAVPCGSSYSCSYAYGRGPAIGSQVSGHILESGVGHCQSVCGGLSHP